MSRATLSSITLVADQSQIGYSRSVMDVQLKTRGQKFMSFKDHAGAERGNISLGRHGVKLASTTGDFCEWHPRRKGEQPFEEGDVVGFDEDSCLTRRTKSGGRTLHLPCVPTCFVAKTLPLPCVSIALGMIGIISKKCIVEGHLPPPEAQPFYDRVAYCGLVPCKVRGSWRSGDCLVPSGRKDGTATAQRSGLFGVSATVGRTVGASSKSGKSSICGKLEDDGQPRMAECVVVGPSLTSALGGLLLTPGP